MYVSLLSDINIIIISVVIKSTETVFTSESQLSHYVTASLCV